MADVEAELVVAAAEVEAVAEVAAAVVEVMLVVRAVEVLADVVGGIKGKSTSKISGMSKIPRKNY